MVLFKKDDVNDGRMYINLPESVDQTNTADLLEHAALWFEEAQQTLGPIQVYALYLQYDYEFRHPKIFADYDVKDKEEISEDKRRAQNREIPEKQETIVAFDEKDSSGIGRFIQQLPKGDEQSDITALLKLTAKTIREHHLDHQVEDLTYHDRIDDDGLSHPIMRVYFTI